MDSDGTAPVRPVSNGRAAMLELGSRLARRLPEGAPAPAGAFVVAPAPSGPAPDRPGNVIAALTRKGGVGKSAIVVSLAWTLHQWGLRVLLVDMDAQQTAARDVGQFEVFEQDHGRAATVQLLQGDAFVPYPLVEVGELGEGCLHTVTGGPALATWLTLCRLRSMADGPEATHVDLRRSLAPVADDYDVVLVDSPPGDEEMGLQILGACSSFVTPVSDDPETLNGITRLLDRWQTMPAEDRPAYLGVVRFGMSATEHRLAAQVSTEANLRVTGGQLGVETPLAFSGGQYRPPATVERLDPTFLSMLYSRSKHTLREMKLTRSSALMRLLEAKREAAADEVELPDGLDVEEARRLRWRHRLRMSSLAAQMHHSRSVVFDQRGVTVETLVRHAFRHGRLDEDEALELLWAELQRLEAERVRERDEERQLEPSALPVHGPVAPRLLDRLVYRRAGVAG